MKFLILLMLFIMMGGCNQKGQDVSCDPNNDTNGGTESYENSSGHEETAFFSGEESSGLEKLNTCPEELSSCYKAFPPAEECDDTKEIIRFFYIENENAQNSELKACLHYFPKKVPCCNGYIANKSEAMADYSNYCDEDDYNIKQNKQYINSDGIFDPGLITTASENNFICLKYQETDYTFGLVRYYEANIQVDTDEKNRIHCNYKLPLTEYIDTLSTPWSDDGNAADPWINEDGDNCMTLEPNSYEAP